MEKLPKDVFDIIGSCLELGRESGQIRDHYPGWSHLEAVSPSFADKFYDSLVKARQSRSEYSPVFNNIRKHCFGGGERKGYKNSDYDRAEDLRRRGIPFTSMDRWTFEDMFWWGDQLRKIREWWYAHPEVHAEYSTYKPPARIRTDA